MLYSIKELLPFVRRKGTGWGSGMNAGLPEDLIRHPVANSREFGLIQEKGLEGLPRVALQNPVQIALVKGGVLGLRGEIGPPVRRRIPLMKEDFPEHARIRQDQGARFHDQDQMLVPGGDHFLSAG